MPTILEVIGATGLICAVFYGIYVMGVAIIIGTPVHPKKISFPFSFTCPICSTGLKLEHPEVLLKAIETPTTPINCVVCKMSLTGHLLKLPEIVLMSSEIQINKARNETL
jgi:hypothetical protein